MRLLRQIYSENIMLIFFFSTKFLNVGHFCKTNNFLEVETTNLPYQQL